MTITNKREALMLFLGDILVFVAALWLTLLFRYQGIPSAELFQDHIVPFSVIFLFWVIVFFIAGLYEKHTSLLKSRLPTALLNAQIVNSVVAVTFFYFLPYFGINPKTNLFIYLVISFLLILGWRLYGGLILGFRHREKAILIGSGEEMRELKKEINSNDRYSIKFISSIDLNNLEKVDFQKEVLDVIYSEKVFYIVVDLKNEKVAPILPKLYNLIFPGVKFVDMYKVYGDTFDRVPLSALSESWFIENLSQEAHLGYDILKQGMDFVLAFVLGLISLVFYPFVALAIKLEDGGPVFIVQKRIGQNNKLIKIAKFRSMNVSNDDATAARSHAVTRVGKILRRARVDELPQLWSVVTGRLSLVGPRPEVPELAQLYSKDIQYYNVRHLIKPGLSGWAQIHHDTPPKFGVAYDETKTKLSYDLFYLKNRSLILDVKIALKTIKTLISQSGV